MKKDTGFFEKIYEQVKKIPEGRVSTYGRIAEMAGRPRAARFVGYALHSNPYYGDVPCHRVVFKDGSLAKGFVFGGEGAQRSMLENEGVSFKQNGKVDMEKNFF